MNNSGIPPKEMPLTKNEVDDFVAGVEGLRKIMQSKGFSPHAVGMLGFDLTKFDGGDSGTPYYVIGIQGPGSLTVLNKGNEQPVTMAPKKQAVLLAVEVGMNLFDKVDMRLQEKFNLAADTVARNFEPEIFFARFETATSRDIPSYFRALNELAEERFAQFNVPPHKAPPHIKPLVPPQKPPQKQPQKPPQKPPTTGL